MVSKAISHRKWQIGGQYAGENLNNGDLTEEN
jgi:hypothetical protein